MPEEARAVQHLTSSQLLNVLRRRDLLRVDENLGRDECLAKLHAAGVKEVPADEVAPTARPTPAAKAASSGSSAGETGVARARSEERASPDPSPVAARPFAASRPALLQGFLRKRPVRSLWGSTRRRWISLGEETIGWSEDEQSAQLGALPLGGAVVELSESKRELSVSVGAQSLVLLAAGPSGPARVAQSTQPHSAQDLWRHARERLLEMLVVEHDRGLVHEQRPATRTKAFANGAGWRQKFWVTFKVEILVAGRKEDRDAAVADRVEERRSRGRVARRDETEVAHLQGLRVSLGD